MSVLSDTYTNAIAWALLHFVWQGAALALLTSMLLRTIDSPLTRYTVACIGLLVMATAPGATIWWLMQPGVVSLPATVQPATGFVATAVPSAAGGPLPWSSWMVLAWTTGVAACSVRAAGGLGLAMWRMRAHRIPATGALAEAAKRIAATLGIRQQVRVFVSPRVNVPSVIGIVRPIVVFPASIVSGLPAAQLEMILTHELAHVARHDFLVNCLQVLVESTLFYHPGVWWLSARIRDERELCCDDVAVSQARDSVSYARALLAIEETRSGLNVVPAADGGDLRQRIARLLGQPRAERTGFTARVLVGLLLLAGAGTVWAVQDAPPPPPPPPPPAPGAPATPPTPPKPPREKGSAEKPGVPAPPAPPDAPVAVPPPPPELAEELTDNREQRIRRLEARIERLRRVYSPGHPDIRALEAQLRSYRELTSTDPEDNRRLQYARERFGNENSDRGRIYRMQGPPTEIESHPSDNREIWRYAQADMEFEFRGTDYRMTRVRVHDTDYVNTPKQQ